MSVRSYDDEDFLHLEGGGMAGGVAAAAGHFWEAEADVLGSAGSYNNALDHEEQSTKPNYTPESHHHHQSDEDSPPETQRLLKESWESREYPCVTLVLTEQLGHPQQTSQDRQQHPTHVGMSC